MEQSAQYNLEAHHPLEPKYAALRAKSPVWVAVPNNEATN